METHAENQFPTVKQTYFCEYEQRYPNALEQWIYSDMFPSKTHGCDNI